MIEKGAAFLRGYYPAEWGGVRGISEREARSLSEGLLAAALLSPPQPMVRISFPENGKTVYSSIPTVCLKRVPS